MKSQRSRQEVAILISKIWGIEETIAVSRFTFKPRLEMAGFSLHCDSPPQLSVGRSSLSIVDVSYAKKWGKQVINLP